MQMHQTKWNFGKIWLNVSVWIGGFNSCSHIQNYVSITEKWSLVEPFVELMYIVSNTKEATEEQKASIAE